jgi:hypothetical protein
MIKFTTILWLCFTSVYGQGKFTAEQTAYNYFITEIFNKKYPDSKKMFFSGHAKKYKNLIFPFTECFANSNLDYNKFFKAHENLTDEVITIEKSVIANIKYLKEHKSRQLNVSVFKSVKIDDLDYVYIHVYLEHHFVDHFLIQISNEGKVSYCEKAEII